MENIKLYEVSEKYVNHILPYASHLFKNKQKGQQNTRKYIGVILNINGVEYFAPLSSFKDKHKKMIETLDFIKIKNCAVININNMFPVPTKYYSYVDFSAAILYKLKVNGEKSSLTKRCNDFLKLEEICKAYK